MNFIQECTVLVHHIAVSYNEKLATLWFNISNDGIHDSLINVTSEFFVDFEKITCNVKINIPENKNDQNYRREVHKTSLDLQKFFEGVQGSFFSRVMLENIYQSINFVPGFPMKKVKLENINVRVNELFFCAGHLQSN